MRIGLDVMGGDHAPESNLEGVAQAIGHLAPDDALILFGVRPVIDAGLAARGIADPRIEVVDCPQTIGMAESPVEAVRSKPGSSIVMMHEAGSARRAEARGRTPLDAVISAGNTGACVAAAQMHMRRLPHVHRPGIAVTVPTFAGPVVLIDVGANIEPKPHHLAQYGVMGDVYARKVLGIERPRVALMNVGGEEQKGTSDMKQARDLLRNAAGLEFIGYVEGRGVFDGEADVVVTEGVVGNVMIKLAEGLSAGIFRAIGREVKSADPELAQRFGAVVKRIYAQHDYEEYGGAPLLGVGGLSLIAHGSSGPKAIASAILRSRVFVESRVNESIVERLGAMEEAVA